MHMSNTNSNYYQHAEPPHIMLSTCMHMYMMANNDSPGKVDVLQAIV